MIDWMLSAQNDVARLPALVWQQWWLSAGWSVVVAWLGAWSVRRWTTRQVPKLAVAVGLTIWVWLPGSWGGAYWLGLAFQAPSVAAVICALFSLRMLLWPKPPEHFDNVWSRQLLFLVLCGVALGWILMLDTLGVWHGSFYNLGFGAAASATALGIAVLPWIFATTALPSNSVTTVATATLLFVALRLPTGNLFDALIDPWLWGALQWALIQQWRRRPKPAST